VVFLILAVLGSISAGAQSYLPLRAGRQWELRSSAVGQSMTFTVESGSGNSFNVRWQNPWVAALFSFDLRSNQVLLRALDMGNGTAPMPNGTVYFDFGPATGATWSNAIGQVRVAAKGLTIKTPAGQFSDCIEIIATDKGGAKTFWFFAPDVGFVQFGEGKAAFLLTSYKKSESAAPTATSSSAVPTPVLPAKTSGKPHIYLGLESNPTPALGYSFEAKRASFAMSRQAGSQLVFVGPKWGEIEKSPGHYDFNDVDDRVRLAEMYGAVVLLNIRVIDTNQRSVPAAYNGMRWTDPELSKRFVQLLKALAPHLKGRCRWVTVGNEVDGYFSGHSDEIEPYAAFLVSISPDIHKTLPNLPLAVNFTTSAVGDLRGKYRAITDRTEIYSLNFYPMNADFTFRAPATTGRELQQIIINTATDKPIVFQEMGYPSSAKLGSSEEKQAAFLEQVLAVLQKNLSRVQAVSFNWRSDLPDSVVDDLTKYYKLPNSGNFRAFLASLGWFQTDGKPKKIWSVFEKDAPAFAP
jgi:hypothetical protein